MNRLISLFRYSRTPSHEDITDVVETPKAVPLPPLPPLSQVVEGLGFGCAQLRIAITGGAIWMADGAELLIISATGSAVGTEWKLTPFDESLLVTFVFVGVFVGNYSGGSLGDTYGRVFPILVSYAGIFVFSILSACTFDYLSLIICRMLVGISFGIGQPAETALVAETTPTHWRICMMVICFVLFALGEIYSAMVIRLEDPQMIHLDWRFLVSISAIPACIFGIGTCLFTFESPFFLSVTGDHDGAVDVLRKMRRANRADSVSIDFAHCEAVVPTARHQLGVVFGRHMLASTLIMVYTTVLLNIIYYGGLYGFTKILTDDLHLGHTPADELISGAILELLGYCVAGLAAIGSRKMSTVIYLILTGASLLVFAAGMKHGNLTSEYFGFYGIKFFPSIGFVVVYILAAEIYPSDARVTGTGICFAGGRIGAMIAAPLFTFLDEATGSYAAFFWILGLLSIGNVMIIHMLPETDAMQDALPLVGH